jgi:hypothetical protein
MLKALQILVLFLAVAFFLALAGLAYLSSPPPTYPSEQQTATQATEKQPHEKQHTFGGLINFLFPDAISIFTFWLVVATIVLGIIAYVQIDFLKRAEGIAAKTAQAAKESAAAAQQSSDAIANVERPYIFIVPKPSKIAEKDGPAYPNPTVSYSVTNFGRVPAIIRLVYTQCFKVQQLSPNPTYSRSKFKPAQSAIAAGATSADFPVCELDAPLIDTDWADIKADKNGIVFTAIFLYEGALDYTYVTTCTYKIDMFTGKAYPLGGTVYNYDKSERGRIIQGAQIPLPNIVP